MPERRIKLLLADNHPRFLASYAEWLGYRGYLVTTASSVEAARHHLEHTHVHVAIFDLRLVDDHDEHDRSGLELARQSDPAVPKIMLTLYPTVELLRDGMAATRNAPAATFYWINKKTDDNETLARQIEKAADQLPIQWDLEVEWHALTPLSATEHIVAPGTGRELLDARAEELTDLFRMIGHGAAALRLEQVLWRVPGRMAIKVRRFVSGQPPATGVLVCGEKLLMQVETERYHEFAPRGGPPHVPRLDAHHATTHFAANLYAYDREAPGTAESLDEWMRRQQKPLLEAPLTVLFTQTLPAWHQEAPLSSDGPVEAHYRQRTGLSDVDPAEIFGQAVQALGPSAAALDVTLTRRDGQLEIVCGRQTYRHADPAAHLRASIAPDKCAVTRLPGRLDRHTLFFDQQGQPLLTDFLLAGAAPRLSAHVELEAVARYDWMGPSSVADAIAWERLLSRDPFVQIPAQDAPRGFNKALPLLRGIRRYATRLLDNASPRGPYELGLLFEVAARLRRFAGRSNHLTHPELLSALHLIVSAGMLADVLADAARRVAPETARPFVLDEAAQTVWIDQQQKSLQPRSCQLLVVLYRHAPRVCSREQLLTEVLGILPGRYDPSDASQNSRLSKAIQRLRIDIEPNPEEPRYVIQSGMGYRLQLPDE